MRLEESIQQYVEKQHLSGLGFAKGKQSLTSFYRHVGNLLLDDIRPQQVLNFLDGPRTSPITWTGKYNLLRNFFRFWIARQAMRSLPLPPSRRAAPQTFVPYIYSRAEIRHLLATTPASQSYKGCNVDARTLRTYLILLYGTGMLVSEGRRLLREDVDFKKRLITIRNARLQPSRQIPFGADMLEVLRSYRASHHQKDRLKDPHFFLTTEGQAIKETTMQHTFQKLRRKAGIARYDGIPQPPRLHDFRYTFAVHRLTAWHKHGAEINRMIPALSMYMGYVKLGGAARYLRLTPERFRTQLDKLSSRRGKRHWRDDPALMQFLSKL
jgi:integrase